MTAIDDDQDPVDRGPLAAVWLVVAACLALLTLAALFVALLVVDLLADAPWGAR